MSFRRQEGDIQPHVLLDPVVRPTVTINPFLSRLGSLFRPILDRWYVGPTGKKQEPFIIKTQPFVFPQMKGHDNVECSCVPGSGFSWRLVQSAVKVV
jgi:hypothetical protein